MGTTQQKFEYAFEAKDLIKQGINNLGGNITSQTELKEYADELQNIYDVLPKTEYQEGTEVNLGVTLKGKLDYDNGVVGIGQSEQNGEPTPSTPIAINSVTGNQDVVVSGINEFDKNTVVILNAKMDNNVVTANEYERMAIFKCKPNTTYSLLKTLGNPIRNSIGTTREYPATGVAIDNATYSSTSPKAFTTNANAEYIVWLFYSINDTTYTEQDILDSMQITEGDTASPYEPYRTPTSYQLSLGDKELFEECTIVGSPDNWKYVDNFTRINCTSNMTWYKSSTTAVDKYYTRTPYDFDSSVTGESVGNKCTHFIFKNNASVVGQWDYNQNNDKLALFFCFATYNTSNINSFKTWLDSANMSCVVKVPTPIETPITDETLISQLNAWYNAHSNNGTTIITSNGDLPMIIKVRGLKGE